MGARHSGEALCPSLVSRCAALWLTGLLSLAGPEAGWLASGGIGLAAGVIALAPAARAELPPWVYGDQQRQAPLVAALAVQRVSRVGADVVVRGRVERVIRQTGPVVVTPGQVIQLRYAAPPERAVAMVGPSPLRLPKRGERLTAWLTPIRGETASFAPAAGGHSFGPSLEDMREPQGR